MTSHTCDDWSDPNDTPLTRARVRRLLAAAIDGTTDDVEAVLREIGGCPGCLAAALVMMTGIAGQYTPHSELHSMVAADLLLEAVLDESQGRDADEGTDE